MCGFVAGPRDSVVVSRYDDAMEEEQWQAQAIDLLAKYRSLVTLRTAAYAAQPRPARAVFRALAGRYPGVLRELDRRSFADLQARVTTLERVLAGVEPPPQWLRVQALYHGFMRAALRLRPHLRLEQSPVEQVLEAYVPAMDEPSHSVLSGPWLARIARPDGGRLNPVAYSYVAEQLRMAPEEVERLVFF